KNLFEQNFIQYASYVIRDRAIPELTDGLKPVQRRILHTLLENDDGRLTKVANIVGKCMAYHPHGDSSIYTALVNLANKELFIDKQGNFGNLYTGDGASASRYIECRLKPITKEILYNPKITEYVPSYDSRSKEPVTFRAKLPLVLITGAEGIAVGMSTNILSHNIHEVIEAERKCLRGEKFQLYPDFPTGGLIDVSEYEDGLGKIITRAKMDTSDEKRIVITELPYGTTTKSLMESIEKAAKSNKIKVASISDFTSDKVNIEIKLARGVYSKDVVDALYAFTDCEQAIYCNLLVIKDNMPVQMTCTQVIEYHSKQLIGVLKDELELEKAELMDKLHLRTLERIFIEERIYKKIELMKTEEAVIKAVKDGFKPFAAELLRPITDEDVDHLLKIPIRRISLYDMSKNKEEVKAINNRIKEINRLLKHLVEYAISWLDGIEKKLASDTTKR
ncbi:MAG: DNA topoisomerase IV subunit A, partial [Treponema bryantii]|nr:DNA topoisomerase IV subunit A [Treponema bryantii]